MLDTTISLNSSLNKFIPEGWGTRPGCYILFRENESISRIGKVDQKGILYIGKGNRILRRVKSLQDSVLCNSSHQQAECIIKGHNAGCYCFL